MGVRLSFLKILVLIIVTTVALLLIYQYISTSPYFRAYLYVRRLLKVRDPIAYTKKFDPHNKQVADIKFTWKCRLGAINCKDNEYIPSPIFPYEDIETHYVTVEICYYEENGKSKTSAESKYFYVDPYWNIFWVATTQCNEPARFFGPYRLAD